jgi:hypothetical protein
MLDRLLHFLESKHFDLSHPLPEAPNSSASTPSGMVFGWAPRFEDTALAMIEARQGFGQRPSVDFSSSGMCQSLHRKRSLHPAN